MEAWWEGLTLFNKGFAVAAVFFSVLFAWQFLGALLGLHGDSHGDAGHADQHDSDGVSFTLISVRSVLAFGTLFSWAGTLYLMSGVRRRSGNNLQLCLGCRCHVYRFIPRV